jgi:hypothetical protein
MPHKVESTMKIKIGSYGMKLASEIIIIIIIILQEFLDSENHEKESWKSKDKYQENVAVGW